MTPSDYAEKVTFISSQSNVMGGSSKARNELLPLFFYFTVNWTRMQNPDWLTQIQELLERAAQLSRPEFMERLVAYDAAAANRGGGGPMWFMTKAYATFASGKTSADLTTWTPDLDTFMPLSIALGATIAEAKGVAEHHLSE